MSKTKETTPKQKKLATEKSKKIPSSPPSLTEFLKETKVRKRMKSSFDSLRESSVVEEIPSSPPQPKLRKAKKEIKSTASKKVEEAKIKEEKYFESVGRRKTAIARVRLFPISLSRAIAKGEEESLLSSPSLHESSVVNEKPLEEYFSTRELQQTVSAPLDLINCPEQFKVSVRVRGGGTVSQAEAVRHGLARALVLFNSDFRKKLKKAGYLKRDPRMRERKKFGLKRARRAPQWSKR